MNHLPSHEPDDGLPALDHRSSSLELGQDMPPRRPIQHTDVHTRLRQLEYDMEQLTLSNIRLLRTNRILKLDCDRLVDEQTQSLKEELQDLRRMNVQLQRNNRLLQDDMVVKTDELRAVQENQLMQKKNMGPEYEYLIDGKSNCEKTCCYTNLPLSQGFSVRTLPPETEEQRPETQHICRPVIHSARGALTTSLEQENGQLRHELKLAQEDLHLLLQEKDEVAQVLTRELRMKDVIVSQLEQDFARMESQMLDLKDRHAKDYHDRNHNDSISIRIRHTTSTGSPYSPVSDYSLID